MNRRKRQMYFNRITTLAATVLVLAPIYLLVHEIAPDASTLEVEIDADTQIPEVSQETITRLCKYEEPAPADGGTLSDEKERLVRHLNATQSNCERIELIGNPKKQRTQESQNLKATSYVCLGGKMGLQPQNCLVYSFGIKHPWVKFSELVEKKLGCYVYVFEPAVDFIDHYHSNKIRFFNARLSNVDQQAKYKVPGEKGWKYSKFLSVIKEKHFTKKPIDVVRLDVTLDLWKGLSTMLSDGSLLSFVKQLTMEYDIANKNITEVRQMFGIAQWLDRQGFQQVHSQATTTSSTSYAVTYVNSKIAHASSNVPVDVAPDTRAPHPTTVKQIPKVKERITTLPKRVILVM